VTPLWRNTIDTLEMLPEMVRAEGVWRVDGKTFDTLLEAELYVTRPEGTE